MFALLDAEVGAQAHHAVGVQARQHGNLMVSPPTLRSVEAARRKDLSRAMTRHAKWGSHGCRPPPSPGDDVESDEFSHMRVITVIHTRWGDNTIGWLL